ncbi:MAG TPA: DNRLRE domain-containing protein [Firmicutes bacterium]|nr:DNRLRE domain-containing protein [Bacillota bacterium]
MATIFLPARGDTFVYQFCPYRNYSRSRHLSVGQDINGSLGYTLINFRLQSALPVNASIQSARLLLTLSNVQQANSQTIYKVCRIIDNWYWRAVTWRTCPRFDPNALLEFPSPPVGLLSLDLTTAAQKWLSGEYAELGLLICAAQPTRGAFFQAYSTNEPNSDRWPQLMVEYTLPEATVAPPTFVDNHTQLVVPASGTGDVTHDVSLTRIMTVMITNDGPGTVSAHLEISADGTNFISSSAPRLIAPLGTDRLMADVFARYLRVVLTNVIGGDANVNVYFQGQIG